MVNVYKDNLDRITKVFLYAQDPITFEWIKYEEIKVSYNKNSLPKLVNITKYELGKKRRKLRIDSEEMYHYSYR